MFDLQINQTFSVVSLIYCDFRIWNAKEMLQQRAQRPSSETLVRRTSRWVSWMPSRASNRVQSNTTGFNWFGNTLCFLRLVSLTSSLVQTTL